MMKDVSYRSFVLSADSRLKTAYKTHLEIPQKVGGDGVSH